MQIENYKLNNLIQAVNKIKMTPGLPYSTIFNFAKVLQFGEAALKPFFETVKTIQKAHTITEDGKQKFDDQIKMSEELEEISMKKADFPMEELELTVKKEETRLNLDLVKTFMDVFGDKFKVTEV